MSAQPFPQAELFGPTQPWQTSVYRPRMALALAQQRKYRPDFEKWLAGNYAVWEAFEREADRIWNAGKRRYSARTIGEYLRHETALRETPNEHGFKLNDHYWPDLARLYMDLHPDREGFFELRVGTLSSRAA